MSQDHKNETGKCKTCCSNVLSLPAHRQRLALLGSRSLKQNQCCTAIRDQHTAMTQCHPNSDIKLERCQANEQALSHLFGSPPKRFKDPCLCFPLDYNSKFVSMRRTCFKQEARFWAGWGFGTLVGHNLKIPVVQEMCFTCCGTTPQNSKKRKKENSKPGTWSLYPDLKL